MEGTGALTSRTFFAEEITVTGSKFVQFIIHDHHLIVAGVEDNLNTVFYSVYNRPNRFYRYSGAGSVTISDQVVGVKGFREDLIVFAENSIFKLVNIK